MSLPAGWSSGLAFLPNWLNDVRDDLAFDALLSGWVRTSGWRSAGLVWPTEPTQSLKVIARVDGVETLPSAPAEVLDVAKSLRATPTVIWQTPGSAGKLYTQIQPAGRDPGLIWAERAGNDPWTDTDRAYLVLSARLIERSPALQSRLGAVIDPKRLQERLSDASVIAGRMAHDFDNILTGIIGFSDLTAPIIPAGSQASKFNAEIAKVGQRGIVFTQQLHQLSRSGQAKPQPGSVMAAVAKEESRLRAVVPQGLHLVTDIPQQLPAVAMEAGPLGVIIGHLMENAIEASPQLGRVIVSAKVAEYATTDAKAFLGAVNPGTYVEITIVDHGPGLTPLARSKVFVEPFYTTKVRHRGLGLAVVYRTLMAHGGGIRIDSATPPDTGTVVRIVVPLAAQRPSVSASIHSPRPISTSTTGG